jgi:hypothetical protein
VGATYSIFSLQGSKLWEEFSLKGIKRLAFYKEYKGFARAVGIGARMSMTIWVRYRASDTQD